MHAYVPTGMQACHFFLMRQEHYRLPSHIYLFYSNIFLGGIFYCTFMSLTLAHIQKKVGRPLWWVINLLCYFCKQQGQRSSTEAVADIPQMCEETLSFKNGWMSMKWRNVGSSTNRGVKVFSTTKTKCGCVCVSLSHVLRRHPRPSLSVILPPQQHHPSSSCSLCLPLSQSALCRPDLRLCPAIHPDRPRWPPGITTGGKLSWTRRERGR